MKRLLHLLRHEARGAAWHLRGTVAASALVASGATAWIATTQRGGAHDSGGVVLAWAVALGAALSGAAVAGEVFASDAASRRIDGAALLPAGLGRVFGAKLAVALGAAVFAAGAVAAAVPATFAACGAAAEAADALTALRGVGVDVLLALPVVALAAMFAIVLEHSLGAVVAAVLACVASIGASRLLVPWDEWGMSPTPTGALWAAVPATIVSAAAAWLAFVHGPIHLGRRVRRAALGVGTTSAVLALGGAAGASALSARADIAPGDPDAVIACVVASPDGRHAVALVGNRRAQRTCHAWLVEVASGRVTPLPGRFRGFESWADDGTLRLAQHARVLAVSSDDVIDAFDPSTGRLVRTRSRGQDDATPRVVGWARVSKSLGGWLVEWLERGLRRDIADAQSVDISPWPGRVLARSIGTAAVIDLAEDGVRRDFEDLRFPAWSRWLDGGATLLYQTLGGALRVFDVATGDDQAAPVPGPFGAQGARGPHAFVTCRPEERSAAVADARTGRIVAGPWRDRFAWFLRDERPLVVTWPSAGARGTVQVLDVETQQMTDLGDAGGPLPANGVVRVEGGAFLVVRGDAGLDVVGADGRRVRTILPARAD